MNDERLLKKLHTDPDRGMKTLISLYAGIVYAVVRGKLSSSAFCSLDIENCVADTFSEFYCDLQKYDPSLGSIKSWLCVIARNNAMDLLRTRRKSENTVSLQEDAVMQSADFLPEADFEDRQQRSELLKAIQALGEPDREILIRKYYFSQTSGQIAERLHMSVSNVDTRAHRAIKKLREKLGGESS